MSAKPTSTDTKPSTSTDADAKKPTTTATTQQLEEDDEFEDFPVEDWTEEETQVPGGNAHLWEESWDDDDTSEDFAVQLR